VSFQALITIPIAVFVHRRGFSSMGADLYNAEGQRHRYVIHHRPYSNEPWHGELFLNGDFFHVLLIDSLPTVRIAIRRDARERNLWSPR